MAHQQMHCCMQATWPKGKGSSIDCCNHGGKQGEMGMMNSLHTQNTSKFTGQLPAAHEWSYQVNSSLCRVLV